MLDLWCMGLMTTRESTLVGAHGWMAVYLRALSRCHLEPPLHAPVSRLQEQLQAERDLWVALEVAAEAYLLDNKGCRAPPPTEPTTARKVVRQDLDSSLAFCNQKKKQRSEATEHAQQVYVGGFSPSANEQNLALFGSPLFYLGMKNSIPKREPKKKTTKSKTN